MPIALQRKVFTVGSGGVTLSAPRAGCSAEFQALGEVALGTVFVHPISAALGYTVTFGASGTLDVAFRRQDSASYWYVRAWPNGDVALRKVIAYVTTGIATAVGVIEDGDRLAVEWSGDTISVYVNSVRQIHYTSASQLNNQVNGLVMGYSPMGCADLKLWTLGCRGEEGL